MRVCYRCVTKYNPDKSTSTLPQVFCGILCEIGYIGCSMQDLYEFTVVVKDKEVLLCPH